MPRSISHAGDRRPSRRRQNRTLGLEPLESRRLLSTFTVTNTLDDGNATIIPHSLRWAIDSSNQATPGPNDIVFNISASTDPGFDPDTQTWTIIPDGALPSITTPVDIDGFTQANVGIPYSYPDNPPDSPTMITSVPNATAATDGNNAQIRVIVDGSDSSGGTGFTLDAAHSMIRGLIIADFGVGVSIPQASDIGDSIQGDDIGAYLLYPVDPDTGAPLPSPENVEAVEAGNADGGVTIDGANATLGGSSPQDDVVIAGNGGAGVWIDPDALGTQVLGCQIGVIGPSSTGVYWSIGNQMEESWSSRRAT